MQEYEKLKYNCDFTEIIGIKEEIDYDNLKEIPYNIQSIGKEAFRDEPIYEFPYMPDLKYIRKRAFQMSKIEAFDCGPYVLDIEDYAFCNCTNLKAFTFPDSLLTIGKYAFLRAPLYWKLNLPKNIYYIGQKAFSECKIQQLDINSSAKSGLVIDDEAFTKCYNLQTVSICGASEIGSCAFIGCQSLSHVFISSSIENIKPSVFYDCPNLKKIQIALSEEEFLKRGSDNSMFLRHYRDQIEFVDLSLDNLISSGKTFSQMNELFLQDEGVINDNDR